MRLKRYQSGRMTAAMTAVCVALSLLAGCGSKAADSTEAISGQESQQLNEQEIQEAAAAEGLNTCVYAGESVENILSHLTTSQKADQMVMPAIYNTTESEMKKNDYGAILSKNPSLTPEKWTELVHSYQRAALDSEAGIPFIYGQDDVHGVNYAVGTVLFPHNIGLGAANDPDLMYQIGQITADEAKMCDMLWNYSPCVAQSVDPRWGRTYESYGSNLEKIQALSTSYTRGMVDNGLIACTKHFLGDGNVAYGTGEDSDASRLIDRGDASLTEEEIETLLQVYRAQIEAGTQSIMISHSSLNGVKMHENKKYIDILKNEMGFTGFVCGDWNSVQNTSGESYRTQVVNAVNAGVDLLMEVDDYNEVAGYIAGAVEKGEISQERLDDAVGRILRVKLEAGVIDDPFGEKLQIHASEPGSQEYRDVAIKAVEVSQVLVKNENDILPIKEGSKVYVTGPAMNDAKAQCGGWTIDWLGSPEQKIEGVTTILEGLKEAAKSHQVEIITDSKRAEEADVVLLFVGEQSYAEWYGDTEDLQLCGKLGLKGNEKAIQEAKKLGKPTVACIVAGRNVLIDTYEKDWDGIVMSYLPGSEGRGVANVLLGDADFTGTLPAPWYSSVEQIGTDQCWHEEGYRWQ